MKSVLIPTDFSVESLQLIEYAILNYPKTRLDIILVNGYRMPDTKWGLIHFSPKREVNKLASEEFANAKSVFAREHSDAIGRISFELFTGRNSLAFKNFAEQLGVKDAIVPMGAFLNFNIPNCFDPTGFIKKNIENVIEIPLEPTVSRPEVKFSISSLLNL